MDEQRAAEVRDGHGGVDGLAEGLAVLEHPAPIYEYMSGGLVCVRGWVGGYDGLGCVYVCVWFEVRVVESIP